jgi:hypothetical protein
VSSPENVAGAFTGVCGTIGSSLEPDFEHAFSINAVEMTISRLFMNTFLLLT